MQFTYYNDTKKHVSLYKGSLQDYVGSIQPQAMVSFDLDIPSGKGVFIKQWDTGTVMISFIDLQAEDTPKDPTPPFAFCGG